MKKISSWGNTAVKKYSDYTELLSESQDFNEKNQTSLVFGNGRSYGDVCFGKDSIITTNKFNEIIFLDENNGLITCQSGLLLHDLFKQIIPKGWFLSVVPGTQFISIGGAVANDIHGKNHHKKGSFGNHVTEIKVKNSRNQVLTCSRTNNSELFKSTVGGLGLTGIILEVTIQLTKISNVDISQNITPFFSFNEYLEINNLLESEYEYTVAWVDFYDRKKRIKGIFISGNHSKVGDNLSYKQKRIRVFPITPPFSLVNNFTVSILNKLYFNMNKNIKNSVVKVNKFFFPLDILHDWNKAYGKKGLVQYQFVLPQDQILESIDQIQEKIIKSKIKPSLTVLKTFGETQPEGYLSFPRKGVSFAIDFPNSGKKLLNLLNELDKVIYQYGGALYPAKDTRMSSKMFRFSFPSLKKFLKSKDPKMNSLFFDRVNKNLSDIK